MKTVAQIFGFIAIGISLFVYSRRKREHILICKLTQDLTWAMHYLLLGAYSAMATNLICAGREVTFYNPKIKPLLNQLLTVAFISFYVASAIITWKNVFSIFPATSSIISTLAFRLKNPVKIKLLAIPSSLCTLVYNITTSHSISVYVGISITLTTITVSLISTLIGNKKKTEVASDEKR